VGKRRKASDGEESEYTVRVEEEVFELLGGDMGLDKMEEGDDWSVVGDQEHLGGIRLVRISSGIQKD
jgi:hypothetical protein